MHRIALIGETGKVEGTIGLARDITETAEMEELRDRECSISALIHNLPGMVYRCRNDVDWKFDFVSEGCRALTGFAREDFIDNRVRSWNSLIVLEDLERVW